MKIRISFGLPFLLLTLLLFTYRLGALPLNLPPLAGVLPRIAGDRQHGSSDLNRERDFVWRPGELVGRIKRGQPHGHE